VLDTEVLCHELVLRAHVVVEHDVWKRAEVWHVGWRRGLAVAEERGDYDVVFGRIEGFAGACEPEVVGYRCILELVRWVDGLRDGHAQPEYQVG
jgi:hypothetical protein